MSNHSEESRVRRAFRWALGVFFTLAGLNHFLKPGFYAALIPPFLPAPMALVYASGVAEIACGVGLLVARWARWAAWGAIATLVAIYPANIYHAASGGLRHPDLPEWMGDATMAWVRLPFQFVFIAWAFWFTRPPRPRAR
jgi:uncharacterized membrane protein